MAITAGSAGAGVEYLGDLQYRFESVVHGFGVMGIDAAAHVAKEQPLPLQIGEKTYAKGIGHHAPGEILIDLNGEYSLFECEVGVQKQPSGLGSVEFQVFVDGKLAFESGIMRGSTPAKPVRVPLEGAMELRLMVTDAGDGIQFDCANWSEARLTRSASPRPRAESEYADIAPFARVCTWDPERTDGARSTRIEEFRAEDLFLETELCPDGDGKYAVPVSASGVGCIGLQWLEARKLKLIALEFDGEAPPTNGARAELWLGESAWQGSWKPIVGSICRERNRWTLPIDAKDNADARGGTRKARWIMPADAARTEVKCLVARSSSSYETAVLHARLDHPEPGETAEIELYNGEAAEAGAWDLAKPVKLTVRYAKPFRNRPDRTVLRFRLPDAAFGVAVEDVLEHGCVYVPRAGLIVSTDPNARPAKRGRTVLERVREMPDQTFEQALAKTRNPIQDNGPMILSLACDNIKFIMQRDGAVEFETAPEDGSRLPAYPLRKRPCLMQPRFGSGRNEGLQRRLEIGNLPIVRNTVLEDGIEYSQVTCVTPLDDERPAGAPDWAAAHPLCISEFTVRNTTDKPANASLVLAFTADKESDTPADLQVENGRVAVRKQADFLASVDTSEASPLTCTCENGEVRLAGTIRAGASACCRVYVPAWHAAEADQAKLTGKIDLRKQLAAYWQRVLAPAVQIDIPDEHLANVIQMSQIYCLMCARSEDDGKRVAAWIAALSYGPLESEAHSIIRGMDLLGHDEFAQRSLDYFIKRYNEAGFLTTGYTLMGTGWHLWTLGEHYELTHDTDWLRAAAPEVARVCRWIEAQRAKTKKLDCRGDKVNIHGLMPPGVLADWNAFSCHFCLNGYYDAGLSRAGSALADAGVAEGREFAASADEFRDDILRAWNWTRSRMPVYALKDGTWVSGYPGQVHGLGPTNDFFPGQDANRSWCYDVELGAHQLVPAGVLDPHSPDVDDMIEHMEDAQFLHDGFGDYPADASEADWFNLGGFAKVQPFYCRNAEIYAIRDEVKPFIRSYFNALASLLNTETLWLWEHFHNWGAWNKTHETGYFLQQSRWMLVCERGDELWLAPFVTDQWMRNGMRVSCRNAPTRFGKTSFVISSHIGQGYIEAVVEPPTRSVPSEIVIRFRHPEGKSIRSVEVTDAVLSGVDAARECIRVKPAGGRFAVRAEF